MPVQADAVNASIGPVTSFLPAGPNVAAQALLADSTLRNVRALDVAKALHLSVPDVRAGMGAIIAMINATAHGNATSALSEDTSLAGAIGPWMSLDQAMSRFGAHPGPIVTSPSPMWHPDVGPDRLFGQNAPTLGRNEPNDGAQSGEAGSLYLLQEAGATMPVPDDVAAAATQLFQFLSVNGCRAASAGIVGSFQIAFNTTYTPKLVVDDKYGATTRSGLQHVLTDMWNGSGNSGPSPLAPAQCRYARAGTAPIGSTLPSTSTALARVPAPSPGVKAAPPAPVHASMFGGMSGWTIGLLAAAVGAVALANSKHPPKWSRPFRMKGARR